MKPSTVNHVRPATSRPHGLAPAFTLIEVLVVVAIIALLLAVLLPSLKRAREQAMLTTDKANCKQIAISMAEYQSEANSFYPILFNWHLTTAPSSTAPARASYLSIALRYYEKGLAHLSKTPADAGGVFDPQEKWSTEKRDEYEAKFLPEHYVCPFARGREPWELRQVGTAPPLTLWEWRGVMECYQTWMWPGLIRGQDAYGQPTGWGGKALNGIVKHSALNLNQIDISAGKGPDNADVQDKLHRRWTQEDARELQVASPSEVTIIYCAIGEHMEMGQRWIDRGSHRTSVRGGTNAIFADTHVEWVEGTRIGWP